MSDAKVFPLQRKGAPVTEHGKVKPFRHNERLILGVCGHWWQAMPATGIEDALMLDCPRCNRPPSHVLRPVTARGDNDLFSVEHPEECQHD